MKKSYAQTAKQKEASVNAAATPGIAGQNAPKNPATPASSPANPWQKQPQIGTSVKVNEIKEVPAAVPLSSAVPSTPNTHGNGHKKVQNYNQPHQQQYYQYPQYPPEYNQYQYYYPPQQQQYNQQPAFQLPTPNKVKIKIVDPNSNQELKLPTPVKVTIKPATASAEKPVPVVKHPDTGEVIITPAKPVSIKPPTDTPSQVVNGSGASTLKNSPIVSKEDVLKPATAQIKSPVTKPAVPVTSEKVQAKVQDKTSIAIKPTVPKAVTLAEKVALGKSAVSSQKPAEPVKSTYAQPAKKPVEEVSPKAPIIISKPAVVSQPAGKPPAPTAVPAIQNSTSPLISVSPAKTSGPPGLTQSSEPVSEKYTVKKLSAESMPEIEDGQITEYLPEAPLLSTFDHIEYPNSVAKKPYVENGEIKYPVEFLMMFHETITAKPKEMMAWKDIYGDDANRQAPVRMSRQTSDRGRVRGQRGRGAGDRDRGSDRVDMSRQYSNSSRSGRGNLPPKGGRNRGPVAAIHVAPLVKGENAWDPKKMQLDESAAALKVIKGTSVT